MFCYIPLNKVDNTKISLDALYWHSNFPPKPISPIKYKNHMKSFCIIIEGCKLKSLDPVSGRIICEVSEETGKQLEKIQYILFSKITNESHSFFTENKNSYDFLKSHYQPLYEKGEVTLYMKNDLIQCYKDGAWTTQCKFKKGDKVKIGVRLYGIAYQYFKTWTGRCRIQHQAMVMIEEESS